MKARWLKDETVDPDAMTEMTDPVTELSMTANSTKSKKKNKSRVHDEQVRMGVLGRIHGGRARWPGFTWHISLSPCLISLHKSTGCCTSAASRTGPMSMA